MRRSPVSIVILAWNAWDETQACLESLRPTLHMHDQVIVVDNGSTDATPSRLKLFSWVEVVANEENRGFAGGCNQGAELARHDVIVFLNNDTIVNGRWLDALVAPFDDPGVGATGPRSNFVPGPQIVEGVVYEHGDRTGMRQFARQWAEAHRGEVSPTDRLVGFCLAVRRSAFATVGGFDQGYEIGGFEDDDLCRRLGDAQWRLLVAHESFVHHSGRRTFDANRVDWFARRDANRARFDAKFGDGSARDFPLASACLIVRDEVENLPGCLGSIEGLVDEVVVYDTGSIDGTVALAREMGATVIEGYWDDDFSRARNVALGACQGEWIVWLDADETLVCDNLVGLREQLARTGPEVEGFSLAIDNLTGSGVESVFVHSACRMFRRASCEWTGRLHEQVAGRHGHRPVATAGLERARIRHTGYLAETMAQRRKVERNLRVAKEEVERSEGWDQGFSLTSLGRSYMTAGRPEDALDACRRGAAETKNPVTRRLALRTVVEALVALGRCDEAAEALEGLRAASDRQILVNLLDANICRQRGDHQRALALLEQVGASELDDDGFEYDASMFARHRSESLAALGRFSDAADALLAVLTDRGILDTHLGDVVGYLDRADRSLVDLARSIPAEHMEMFLAQALQLQAEVADRVLEACVEAMDPTPVAVLATAATLATRLSVDRALVWSSRLRRQGHDASCPLVMIAAAMERPAVERARAAAAGYQLFSDTRLSEAFSVTLTASSAEEREVILAEAAFLCPELAEAPVEADRGTQTADARTAGTRTDATQTVSIVIPCRDRSEHTARCLQAIQSNTAAGTYEIIVVDNGSTDATSQLRSSDDAGFRVVRTDRPIELAMVRDRGAEESRGDIVVFLAQEALVQPGWLPPLIGALKDQAAALPVVDTDSGARTSGGRPGDRVDTAGACADLALAIRREDLARVGGFADGSANGSGVGDVCRRLVESGSSVSVELGSVVTSHAASRVGAPVP